MKRRAKKSPGSARRISRRGLMLVLSSPSGAGKTTLSRRLLKEESSLTLSISVTTRERRKGEINGQDYRFVKVDEFRSMKRGGELLESATVFGNLYGTPREAVERALAAGKDVLFDIDWQGANQLRRKAKKDVVSVFVLPPSAMELHRRLRTRAQDTEQVIRKRMAEAGKEVSHWSEYDYVIVNYDLEKAFDELRAILAAERLKRVRQSGLAPFVRALKKKL